MKSLRVSLWQIFVGIAFASAALAVLSSPTHLSVVMAFSFTLAVLVLALIGVATLHGPQRAFCAGLAISGWLHLILAFLPSVSAGSDDFLISRLLLDVIASARGYQPVPVSDYFQGSSVFVAMREFRASPPHPIHGYFRFVVIGQCLATLVLGLAGGYVAVLFQQWGHVNQKSDGSDRGSA
jgi:hypothetical protein